MSNRKELETALLRYETRARARFEMYSLPPRPLTEDETALIVALLSEKDADEEAQDALHTLTTLLATEVRRGSYPETEIKARFLNDVISGALPNAYVSKETALDMLIDMNGGAADIYLANALENESINRETLVRAFKTIFYVSKEAVDRVYALAQNGNGEAKTVIEQWANNAWEKARDFPSRITRIAIKTGDNISTDHLSPSKRAGSRTDRPLHARYLMEGRVDEADFLERMAKLKEKGALVMVGGKQFGEGSSRKSATYTLLEVVGETVRGEPEMKTGGVLIAESIAPIYENSLIASGIIPLKANVTNINEGDTLTIDLNKNVIVNDTQKKEIPFEPLSDFTMRKLRAGGMNAYMSQKQLHRWAVEYAKRLSLPYIEERAPKDFGKNVPESAMRKLFTYNRLDGKPYTETGESVAVRIRGVYSQDTTGPMTYDEYLAISGGKTFQSEFVIQSVCHTSECPNSEERDAQKYLQTFAREHGGIGLEVGEGIIHTIANRFVLPTDIIVGGDSHTRSERGVSFPAGSDIVALAMKYGFLELNVDEETLVTLEGTANEGITARDVVSMFVLQAEKDGLGAGAYNGRVVEIQGAKDFSRDERYILTNAIAERSASAGIIAADERAIEAVRSDFSYLKTRYERGDRSASLLNTLQAFEAYLSNPLLLNSDPNAEYAAKITIPLSEYTEPLIAKPHHPDNVAALSEIAGTKLTEVYIGSCVGGDLASIRMAAALVEGRRVKCEFTVTPASQDIYLTLLKEGAIAKLSEAGAVIGIPSCGICMGNKRRVGENAVAFTTTTRNYRSRLGPPSAETYLGSAAVAALSALDGAIVSVERYFEEYHRRVTPNLTAIREDAVSR